MEMEPEVLPVFYYNDLLLSNIGDTIGHWGSIGFLLLHDFVS